MVCSLHFNIEDYSLPELKKNFLKISAIPHLSSEKSPQETIDCEAEPNESQLPADSLSSNHLELPVCSNANMAVHAEDNRIEETTDGVAEPIDFDLHELLTGSNSSSLTKAVQEEVKLIESQPPADLELPICSNANMDTMVVNPEVIPRYSMDNRIEETTDGVAEPIDFELHELLTGSNSSSLTKAVQEEVKLIESQPPADLELPICSNANMDTMVVNPEVIPRYSMDNRIEETIDGVAEPIDFELHERLAGSNSSSFTKAVQEEVKIIDFEDSFGKDHDADCGYIDGSIMNDLLLSDHEDDACLQFTGIYEAHETAAQTANKNSRNVCIDPPQIKSVDLLKASNPNDKGIQVTTAQFPTTVCSLIKTEKDLIIMCNIKSFKILDELVKLMNEIYPTRKRSLTTRECIVLTTAKLKLDIPFAALGVLMNCVCEVTIRNLFYDTLKKLSTILQSTLTRVSKEEIQRNIPLCFKKFRDTVSILDCTEIKIQKPKCLKCRIKLYSHYKGELTVKFLTEVTPAGMIVYVSKAFGGRASDKCIFRHSNIIQYLKSDRDIVMVDKGFLIDNECINKRIRLIRPSFAKANEQIPGNEAIYNREIASARVHVERMNARIKEFRILTNKIPWHFMHNIDDILIVCCGLANLGHPILADDKFDLS